MKYENSQQKTKWEVFLNQIYGERYFVNLKIIKKTKTHCEKGGLHAYLPLKFCKYDSDNSNQDFNFKFLLWEINETKQLSVLCLVTYCSILNRSYQDNRPSINIYICTSRKFLKKHIMFWTSQLSHGSKQWERENHTQKIC